MKNKKKIQDEYKKKVNRLLNLNKAYFDKDKPIVSDSEFDKLKQELINISKKYTFFDPLERHSNPKEPEPENKSKIEESSNFLPIIFHICNQFFF